MTTVSLQPMHNAAVPRLSVAADLIKGSAMQERTLSSGWTFWMKFLFPAIWIACFGFGTILIWQKVPNDAMPPFAFLGAWILGTALIIWNTAGLKRIRIDERQLYLSNYLREISVPFTAISDVRQNRWLSTRPITVHFEDATEFGDKVTFMPKWRFRLFFWNIDPVVGELRQLAGLTD